MVRVAVSLLVLLFAGHSLATDGLPQSDSSPGPAALSPAANNSSSPAEDTTLATADQIGRPPSSPETKAEETQTKAPVVTRQSPSSVDSSAPTPPFGTLKPESKDEMFARIDTDGDNAISLQDYMNRDRYYVESVQTEFNDIDTNRDGKVTKAEFDAFVQRLDEQRKTAMMDASNFTLQKNDANKDGELSVDELGAYINGTLQRSVAQLPEVFRQYDRDGNQRLSLDEFHELDFNFPWEKFPPAVGPPNRQQMLFGANGAIPPPFVAQQSSPIAPQMVPAMPNGAGGPPATLLGPPRQPLVRFSRRT